METLGRIFLTIVVFVADQSGKAASRTKWREENRRIGRPPASATLCYNRNEGAFLNLGEREPLLIRLISVVLTVFLTAVFVLTLGKAGKGLMKTGLSLLLGGAFSNTYDRLKNKMVTDYIRFDFGPQKFRQTVFNLGDFAIMIGALLTVLGS